MRTSRHLLLAALALAIALPAVADDAQRWLRVDVREASSDATVNVRLPMALVLTALDAIDTEAFSAGSVVLETGNADIDWPSLLASLRTAPDGEYVTVDSPDADVVITKSGGTLRIHVDEHREGATVDVTVPATLLDAIHVDQDNRLDVKRLITSLDATHHGELVRVDSPDADVRIWIE